MKIDVEIGCEEFRGSSLLLRKVMSNPLDGEGEEEE